MAERLKQASLEQDLVSWTKYLTTAVVRCLYTSRMGFGG